MNEAPAPRRRGTGALLRAIGVLVIAYLLGFLVFTLTLPRQAERVDDADGIVALTGGDARLDAAVALFERGVGKRLLITGVHPTTTKHDLKRIAHGGPRFDCCADLGFSAANTHGNASEAAFWAREHHYRRLVVVTASYHMPRSLTEFSAEMPGVKLEPYPVEPEGIDLQSWWRDPRALELLQAEYAKYLASLVLTRFIGHSERPELDRRIARGDARRAY